MLTHRFITELNNLEETSSFCDKGITGQNRVLVIGTFNPDNASYPDPSNDAEWFYGRTAKNKFWHYFPLALTGVSLHPSLGHRGRKDAWIKYCNENKVVIIDMIKSISHSELLTSQKDSELERRINPDLSNVNFFQVSKAFRQSTFDKVIYSLAWTEARKLPALVAIRDRINGQLQRQGTIQDMKQIRYCKAPWRNDAWSSWEEGLK